MQLSLFNFKKTWWLSPFVQISIIVIIFIITVIYWYTVFQKTWLTQFGFPVNNFIYLAPIYEEIIFRWFILWALLKCTSTKKSIIYSSILFWIWHLKNIFYLDIWNLLYQIIYAWVFIGPILAYITIKTKTIWSAVILHSLNNLLAPISWIIVSHILKTI